MLQNELGLSDKVLQPRLRGWWRELAGSDPKHVKQILVPYGIKHRQRYQKQVGERSKQVVELKTAIVFEPKEPPQNYERARNGHAGPDHSLRESIVSHDLLG